jgi:hypothetical protein
MEQEATGKRFSTCCCCCCCCYCYHGFVHRPSTMVTRGGLIGMLRDEAAGNTFYTSLDDPNSLMIRHNNLLSMLRIPFKIEKVH